MLLLAFPLSTVRADEATRLSQLLGREVSARGYPGMAMLVQRDSEPPASAAAGSQDLVGRVPMRPDTPFHICSITKTFTAIAALQLVDRGKLSLNATLASLLGEDVKGIPHAGEITVAELLDHSSGIYPTNNDPEYLDTMLGRRANPRRVWSAREMIALAKRPDHPPVAAPGSGHHDSDTNYLLLSMIVEKISGEDYKEHVRRTIFVPLRMDSTYFYSDVLAGSLHPSAPTARGYILATPDIRSAISINPMFPAVGGRPVGSTPLLDTTFAAERIDGAAGIVSTLPDLGKFAAALFRGRLLAPDTQRFLTAAAEGMEREPAGKSRVRALQSIRKPCGVLVYKEGDGPGGFNALMAYSPDRDQIFVGFVNVFGNFDEVERFMDDEICPLLLEGPAPPARSSGPSVPGGADGDVQLRQGFAWRRRMISAGSLSGALEEPAVGLA